MMTIKQLLSFAALAGLSTLAVAGAEASPGDVAYVRGPIQSGPISFGCLPPKQWLTRYVPVPCAPGQRPPGGLFGNQCLKLTYYCAVPPVIN
jgi:hypothetical protein